jgi:hypothetical protein
MIKMGQIKLTNTFLVEGAREHSLPAEHIATLENIDAAQDANAARARRKHALACQAEP